MMDSSLELVIKPPLIKPLGRDGRVHNEEIRLTQCESEDLPDSVQSPPLQCLYMFMKIEVFSG